MIKLIVLLGFLAAANAIGFESNPWTKIEEALVSGTSSEDPEANIGIAREFLERTERTKPALGKSNSKLLDALRRFVDLKSLVNQCDEATSELFADLYLIAHKPQFTTRYGRVIMKIARERGANCRSTIFKNLEERLASLEAGVAEDVEKALEDVIADLVYQKNAGHNRALAMLADEAKIIDAKEAGTVAATCARYLPATRRLKASDNLQDFLIEPCEKYVEKLRGAFSPAVVGDISVADDAESEKFFKHWVQYKACSEFIVIGAYQIQRYA